MTTNFYRYTTCLSLLLLFLATPAFSGFPAFKPFGNFIDLLKTKLKVGTPQKTVTASASASSLKNTRSIYEDAQVFLTVSSLASGGPGRDRMWELNWRNWVDFDMNQDWVGLFDQNPESSTLPLDYVTVNDTKGYYRTSVRFDRVDLVVNGDPCQSGHWIGYVRFGTLLASKCLEIHPKWMGSPEMKELIRYTPLNSLMLPGTHDAGAWRNYAGVGHDNVFIRFSVNQEESLYDQMVYGIRYFDMRVAYYPHTPEIWWINHGSSIFRPLITLFEDVKRFITQAPDEIILMDFHGFPVGFTGREIHEQLVQFVKSSVVGDLLLKNNEAVNPNFPTPHDFWTAGKNVILTYQDGTTAGQHDILWPYLVHAWGNKNNVTELEEYFETEIPRRGRCNGWLWSAMTELTAREIDYIINLNVGLRGFADWVNIPQSYWFQRTHWYENVNIIASDFFLGNNIIEMCIHGNLHRPPCPAHTKSAILTQKIKKLTKS